MSSYKEFAQHNPGVILRDAVALWLAITMQDEIPVRQLLREFESSYPVGYGKQLTVKVLGMLTASEKEWLRALY